MSNKLKFIADPGHGWLEVPRSLYRESGFSASAYSYGSKTHVYLEEDCDAPGFIHAMKSKGAEISMDYEYQENTFVRRLGDI